MTCERCGKWVMANDLRESNPDSLLESKLICPECEKQLCELEIKKSENDIDLLK